MPILHVQYNIEAQTPDGQRIQVPPSVALLRRGPFVQVVLSVAQEIAEQLVQQGQALPQPASGLALIDTGASVTCLDEAAAQQLQLPVIDVVEMMSASHAATQQNVYPIQIEVVGSPIKINVPRAMGATLSPQGIIALLWRDFLQHCTLFYNGITGQITLSI